MLMNLLGLTGFGLGRSVVLLNRYLELSTETCTIPFSF